METNVTAGQDKIKNSTRAMKEKIKNYISGNQDKISADQVELELGMKDMLDIQVKSVTTVIEQQA